MIDIAEALESTYDEVSYDAFYDAVFPAGSFEQKGVYEQGKYNGIAISIKTGDKHAKRYTVTDDHEMIDDMAASDEFCLMSPISYAGKSRKSENARFMYALAIDLDGVETIDNFQRLIEQYERGEEYVSHNVYWGLPTPTYLVSSGTGIHIYYVFKEPVPLFKNIVKQLEKLKRRLTWQAWTQGASVLSENIQYESLFQGFRVVGTITKTGGRCRAFKVGNKVDIEYLNQHIPVDYRVTEFTYKSDLRLDKAKELYPEWYERRIVKKQPRNTWVCNKALYDWWIRKISDEAQQGHRFWCIMTLATYAKKCDVPKETLEEDAYGLIPLMNTKGDDFTEDDVMKALEAYNDSYITYPIHAIEARTGISLPRNKRNGRKQEIHLKGARAIQQINDEANGTNWRDGNGRKPKKEAVEEWLLAHPDGTKAECHRETGIDPKTIRKWWNDKAYAEYMVEKEMEEYRKSLWWNDGQEGVDQAGHREMFEIKYGLRENPCKC